MRFLRKHCQMAWEMAVHDCKLLCDGLTDVTQRKRFISSFTNAIELGFKQILLDLNDKCVIVERRISDTTLLANYRASTDLNAFFSTLSPEELEKFYSAKISSIVDIAINGIDDQTIVETKIKMLLNLRNRETHFYINENNYLSFQEFKDLCDLVNRIQAYFIKKNIIDHMLFGTPEATNKIHASYFNFDISTHTTYNDLIKNSKTNKKLAQQFPDHENDEDIPSGWCYYVSDTNDLYSIAYEVYDHHGIDDGDNICMDFLMNYNEFYRRFVLMVNNNMLHIEKHDSIIELEDGTEEHTIFVVVSKL